MPGDTRASFHRVLKIAREAYGFTQHQLADSLGRKRGWVAHVEQGRISPKLSDVEAWLLECNLELHTKSGFRCACGQPYVSENLQNPHLFILHRCGNKSHG